MIDDEIAVAGAPAIPGLRFRRFRGAGDFPQMVAAIAAGAQADQVERAVTVEDLARGYAGLTHCDPYQDMILAEVAGELVGYSRGSWWDEADAGRLYGFAGLVVPAWRRKGIGRALVAWIEQRLRAVAAQQAAGTPCFYQVAVSQHQAGAAIMLERAGYRPVRHYLNMLRPTLDDIPDAPLPAGLEIRPVTPEHYRAIWASVDETSRDEAGYEEATEEGYQAWLRDELRFQPDLWQVAWDTATGRVAGHLLAFIDHAANAKYGRRRGYTEGLGVDRAWRRRGVGRALIARSLQAQRAAGMTESATAADGENPSVRLFASCGFQLFRRDSIYRKPLAAGFAP